MHDNFALGMCAGGAAGLAGALFAHGHFLLTAIFGGVALACVLTCAVLTRPKPAQQRGDAVADVNERHADNLTR